MSVVRSASAGVGLTGPAESALSDHISQVGVGREASFGVLYDEFAPTVHGISARIARSPEEAEAITVATFVFLWRHAARWRDRADVCRIAGVIALRTSRSSAVRLPAVDGRHE